MNLENTTLRIKPPNDHSNRSRCFSATFRQTTIIKNAETPISIDMDAVPVETLMNVAKKIVEKRGDATVEVQIRQTIQERQSNILTKGNNSTLIVGLSICFVFICAFLLFVLRAVND